MDFTKFRNTAIAQSSVTAISVDPITVTYQDGKLAVKAHPFDGERMKLVLGVRFHRASQTYVMPATRAQLAGLYGQFGDRVTVADGSVKAIAGILHPEPAPPVDLADHLYPFQADGVRYLMSAGSALLGDSMGTGKTIQAAEWMRQLDFGPHLVVCPNSMKFKWKSELEKWTDFTVVAIDGDAEQRRKQIAEAPIEVVFVINYEGLRAHTRLAPWGGKALTAKQKEEKDLNEFEWGCVVVDEAHRIKDPKSQQTMAVKQMGLQAEHRLAMTGTPLINNPDDIWSIMNFVEPDEYGSRNQFRAAYCNMVNPWHGGGPEAVGLRADKIDEFDKFFQPRFLRRTKEEVLPDLPEKATIDYRLLPLSPRQASFQARLIKDMMAMQGDELLVAENPLVMAMRLRQAACAELVIEDGEVVGMMKPSNKLDAILDILEESAGDPIVVYAESRKFIEFLQGELVSKGYTVGMVTGGQNPRERQKNIDDFQDGKLDVMLGTLGAGAEGITLTAASTIVLAQQSWSHATNAQAIDRVHRIGQTRGVQPIVLISKGTIDEAVAVTDITKEIKLQELVRDPAWLAAAAKGQT